MDVIFTHGAGLEVYQETVMACRVPPDPMGQRPDGLMEGREFGPLTRARLALSDGGPGNSAARAAGVSCPPRPGPSGVTGYFQDSSMPPPGRSGPRLLPTNREG
jgi:hypothetical protein